MNKIFLLLFLSTSFNTIAQNYIPLPDSAVIWHQESYIPSGCCCSGTGPCLDQKYYRYSINGDTLIGSANYRKIYKTGRGVISIVASPSICPPWCNINGEDYYYHDNIYAGAMRQDVNQRKVFFMPPDSSNEKLLYDFNLNIGDTLPDLWIEYFGSGNVVTGIDSILIAGVYHRRYDLSISFFPYEVCLIEGIGSSTGLLGPLFTNINVSLIYNKLICVSVDGTTIYPDTGMACGIIQELNDMNNDESYSVFPNPFSDVIHFFSRQGTSGDISFFDLTSRKILQQTFSISHSINTVHLAKGIYFYHIRSKNGAIQKGKLVKE